ncbi:hypothetical protein SAMN05216391_10944 [Lachnospiraceae bacterium KHCPX20]|nr:hypothetical protein SAMN05216391_10944 [Lachnospiraceae bacterium KHCPX20]
MLNRKSKLITKQITALTAALAIGATSFPGRLAPLTVFAAEPTLTKSITIGKDYQKIFTKTEISTAVNTIAGSSNKASIDSIVFPSAWANANIYFDVDGDKQSDFNGLRSGDHNKISGLTSNGIWARVAPGAASGTQTPKIKVKVTNIKTKKVSYSYINLKISIQKEQAPVVKTTTIGTVKLANEGAMSYTGSDILPSVILYSTSGDLLFSISSDQWIRGTQSIDGEYTYRYQDSNVSAKIETGRNIGDTVSIKVNGLGKYSGSVTENYTIEASPDIEVSSDTVIGELSVSNEKRLAYTGWDILPTINVSSADGNLIGTIRGDSWSGTNGKYTYNDGNFSASMSTGREVGDAIIVTVTGTGTYSGTVTNKWEVTEKAEEEESEDKMIDISNYQIAPIPNQAYTGELIEPEDIIVKDQNGRIVPKDAYSVEFANNRAVGIATVTIRGNDPYVGVITQSFNIIVKSIENAKVYGIPTSVKYTEEEPKFDDIQLTMTDENGHTITLENDKDYEVLYDKLDGQIVITIEGRGTYVKSITKVVPVICYNLMNATVTGIHDVNYNGEEVEFPSLLVKTLDGTILTAGEDYEISYKNNDKPGTAYVILTAAGSSVGKLEIPFTITMNNIENTVIDGITDRPYTGDEIEFTDITVKSGDTWLTEGEDYEISYSNNTKIGTAKVTIKGIGTWSGRVTKSFKILENNLSNAVVTGVENQLYTGDEITLPDLSVSVGNMVLAEGEDYEITYSNNTKIGTAKVTIKGIGTWSGRVTKSFKILENNLSNAVVTGVENQLYTGDEITLPDLSVSVGNMVLAEGEDYEITYSNNTKIGTAKVTIKGIGTWSGRITKTFEIAKKSFVVAKIDGVSAATAYTGDEITFDDLQVMIGDEVLVSGVDYMEPVYVNNVDPGMASVIIRGTGAYKGAIKKSFKIVKSKNMTDFDEEDNAKTLDTEYYDSYQAAKKAADDEEKISIQDVDITVKNVVYNGTIKKPFMELMDGDYELVYKKDYTVSGLGKVPGTYRITINGLGKYKGVIKKNYTVKMPKTSMSCTVKKNKISLKLTMPKATNFVVKYKKNGKKWKAIKIKAGNKTTIKKSLKVTKGTYQFKAYGTKKLSGKTYNAGTVTKKIKVK